MTVRSLDLLDPRAKAPKPVAPFELGTHVVYTHRAAVARRTKVGRGDDRQWAGWSLYDGWPVNGMIMPGEPVDLALAALDVGDAINKTIAAWEEEGSGVIVGLVKKQIGRSVSPHTSTSYGGEEHEAGWFEATGEQWLYAIRRRLEGLDFILVPVDAVRLP